MRSEPARVVSLALLALATAGGLPARAAAADHSEHYSVSFGGFLPSGPAALGTWLGFNAGSRVSDTLRIGAEVNWYRRDYDSSFLLVSDAASRTGVVVRSIASTHLFPLLGTADYYLPGSSDRYELYVGGGAGYDILRTKHYPDAAINPFVRTLTGLAYMARFGMTTKPNLGPGALYTEVFYKGSTIDGEDDLVDNRPADVETRASGVGFRVGFRW